MRERTVYRVILSMPSLRKGLRDVGEIIAQTRYSSPTSNNAGTITRPAFAFANNGGRRPDTPIGGRKKGIENCRRYL